MHDVWLSNAYVLADEPGGTAVFVDSGAPLEPLLDFVKRERLTMTYILRTHGHTDHVIGEDELAERFGVPVTTGSVRTGGSTSAPCRRRVTPRTASRSSPATSSASRVTRSSATRSAAAPMSSRSATP